jgi:4-amino-4-deoxy-L-arabinose transferase-like glycosyltransferase
VNAIGRRLRAHPVLMTCLVLVTITAVAVLVRSYRLGPSFGLFVDEITYLHIGRSMATDGSVNLYGEPFFLHPPLFFVFEALVLWVVQMPEDVFGEIYRMRYLSVAFAGASAGTILTLVHRSTLSWISAAVAAGFYAIDPFAVKITSRVLLEPAAGLWVLLGYSVLVVSLTSSDRRAPHGESRTITDRRSTRPLLWIAAGVFFGLAVLTKEPVALFTLVPLAAAAVLGWVPRRQALMTGVVAIITYLPYPIYAASRGEWATYLEQKFTGVLRLGGVVQMTGFNVEGSVPFAERVIERLDTFAGTYAILAFGVFAIPYLLLRGRSAERLLALWAGSAYTYGGFSIIQGTLEEQFFYYVLLPGLIVAVIAIHRAGYERQVHIRPVRLATVGCLLLYLGFSGAAWYEVRTQRDDSYAQLATHLAREAPEGVGIAVGATSETAQFVLRPWAPALVSDPDSIVALDLSYVVVGTKSLKDGTANAAPDLFEFLAEHGELRFRDDGRTVGTLLLYEVPEVVRQANAASAGTKEVLLRQGTQIRPSNRDPNSPTVDREVSSGSPRASNVHRSRRAHQPPAG